LWGAPGNGKTATLRVMAAHPHIQPYALDLSDMEEKSADVLHLFEKAGANTPAPVILEDLDRAFPTEGKRTQERRVSFQNIAQLPRRRWNARRRDRGRHSQRPHLLGPGDPEATGTVRPRGSVPKSGRPPAPRVLQAAQSDSHGRAV